jgi:membrane-associated phospholipid phosphatase
MLRIAKLLMPVEWALVLGGLLTVALYAHFGLEMPGQPGPSGDRGPFLFYLKQIYTSLYLYALLFNLYVACKVFSVCRSHRWSFRSVPWRAFWPTALRRFDPVEVVQDARFFHAVLLMFIEFQLLKHLIPHVHPGVYDGVFLATERLVCGGRVCAEWLHLALGMGAANAVSTHYHWYYHFLIGVPATFILVAERRLAQEYLFAFVLLFLLGVLFVFLIPTWGPAFYAPELFTFIGSTESGGLQQDLWSMKGALEKNPHDRTHLFSISGFPSLHVAVVLLGSIYIRKINYFLSLVSWSFLLLIVNSTIYLGWHYVLDDVGSVVLVFASIWIARRVSWEWRVWFPVGQVDEAP